MTQQANRLARLASAAIAALYCIARFTGICRDTKIPGIPVLAVGTGTAGADPFVDRVVATLIHRGTVKGF